MSDKISERKLRKGRVEMKSLKRLLALGVVLAMLVSTPALAAEAEYWFGDGSSGATQTDTFEQSIAAVNGYGGEETAATIRLLDDVTVESTVTINNTNLTITIDGDGQYVIKAASTDDAVDSGAFSGRNMVETYGDVIMTDLTLDANNEARVIEVKDGTLTLAGETTVTEGRSPDQGGGVRVTSGTLEMRDNSQVTNNYFGGNAGGISIFGAGTVNMWDNASVTYNTGGGNGGGIWVYNGGELHMYDDSVVSNNTSGNCGGGIYTGKNHASFTMEGNASITDNQAARYGGGVFISDGAASFTANGNSLISNNTALYGGGLTVDSTSVGSLNDSTTISGNTSTYGGGIHNNGTVTMNDSSSVSGNAAANQRGGVGNYGTFEMNGSSSVSGNTAGTGIAGVLNAGTFIMNENASITGNTTPSHSGALYNKGSFTMNGGEISGNEASNGAAINVIGAAENLASVTLNGGVIQDNITAGGNCDFNVRNYSAVTITGGTYDATFSESGSSKTITITGGVFGWNPEDHTTVGSHYHDDGFYHVTDQACSYAQEEAAATCTENGLITYTCSCGYSYTAVLDATGHTAGEPVVISQEADYGVDGYRDVVTYCTGCGVELSREHTVLPALVHEPTPEVTTPTVNAPVVNTPVVDAPIVFLPITFEPEPESESGTDSDAESSTAAIEILDEETPLSGLPIKNDDEGITVSEAIEEISQQQGGKDVQSEAIVELLVAVMDKANVSEDEYITREQFAYALYNLAKERGIDVSEGSDLSGFTDRGSISEYALAAVQWAVKVGLLKGISVDLLAPDFNLTYRQMIIILERFAALAN